MEQHPFTDEQFAGLGGGAIAYVRPIRSEDVTRLFPEAPALEPGQQLFALCSAAGQPIVLSESRDMVIANAMEHKLQTLSVH